MLIIAAKKLIAKKGKLLKIINLYAQVKRNSKNR